MYIWPMDAKVTLLLILANVIFSILGFSNSQFFERYLFRIGDIRKKRQYERLLTSGFLHVDYMHLTFNMFTLYFFGSFLENRIQIPIPVYVSLYFISLLAGNILALWLNKNKLEYAAVGASGAVSGILFATIALYPDLTLGLFFVIPMPAWLYGIGFMLYSLFGMRSKNRNIGHEAHLGGALAGIIGACVLYPQILERHLLIISLMTVPSLIFLFISIKFPYLLEPSFYKKKPNFPIDIDAEFYENKQREEQEINRILEKINAWGIESLSSEERIKLERWKNKIS